MEDLRKYKNVVTVGDSYEVLKELPDNSVDACVTDPPYGLSREPDITEVLTRWLNDEKYEHPSKGFMGKEWDSFVPSPLLWKEVYRVLKPGGHILCFAGTRTQDLMTIALRIAGFEIRDVIEWLYLSGFPKNYDVSKGFDKRDGAKRLKVGEYQYKRKGDGTWDNYVSGGMFKAQDRVVEITVPATELAKRWEGWGSSIRPAHEPIILCRKPLKKTILDNLVEFNTGAININACRIGSKRFPTNCVTLEDNQWYSTHFNITPQEISKKASKKDRNSDWRGNVIDLEECRGGCMCGSADGSLTGGKIPKYRNIHPTVKPTGLMQWLVRLITPPGGTVLDPFCGSGSTAVAARREGLDFIVIEKEEEYAEIAQHRAG